ncbi:Calx-beta domain-containing protein [Spongiimicrobium sp. 3-5]|uniref:Calx-beta domain-containing protein n=1 Tax=Spongiimicrobium sp. 3-5 TaxID=3332596 RepID=UPI00397ED874
MRLHQAYIFLFKRLKSTLLHKPIFFGAFLLLGFCGYGQVLTIENATETEGTGLVFTVTVDVAVGSPFTVTTGYVGGTATGGALPLAAPEDYNNTPQVLNFTGVTPGEAQQFTVETFDNLMVEGTEIFAVTLTSSNIAITDSDTAIGAINDNDSAAVTIENVTVTEGAGLLFTVTLNASIGSPFTVTTGYTGGTATGGALPLAAPEDYNNTPQVLNFTGVTPGETQQFTVDTFDDLVLEGIETFTVTLASSNIAVGDSDTAIGTINDNDTASVTIENVTVTEGAGLLFTVTSDVAVGSPFTVTTGYTGGTATGGALPLAAPEDYNNTPQVLNFTGVTPGETQQFTVDTFDDLVVEGPETFTVTLTSSNPSVTDSDTAIGTINDNDTAAVTVENVTATEGAGLLFTVTLNNTVASGAFTVTTGYTNVSATGGALPLVTPEDYNNEAQVLNFAGTAGETQQFTVATLNDLVVEGTETFTVTLTSSNPAVTDSDTAIGAINDNDTAAVTIENVTATEGAGLLFTVTLNNEVATGAFTVTTGYTGGTATGGALPLVAPEDYNNTAQVLNFTGTAGQTRQFTVATLNDVIVEGPETFTVTLTSSNPSVTDSDTAIGTINDNDAAAITVEDVTVTEGAGLLFTVTLNNTVASGAFTVTTGYTDVSATGGALPLVSPEDYNNTAQVLNFAGTAGETQQFTVATLNDVIVEGPETFTVTLTSSNPSVTDSDTAIGTINDNDTAAVTVENVTATEGAGLLFTVTLNNEVATGAFTVTTGYTGGTATGGALPLVAPEDYNNTAQVLNFTGTAGQTRQFTVATLNDVIVEGPETFTVTLTSSNPAVTDSDTAIGTINDNDTAAVTVENVTATEGAGLLFTVTLNNEVATGAFTVTTGYTGGTATGGALPLVSPEDYNNTAQVLNFTGTAGQTRQFTVATLNDVIVEGPETFTVTLTSSNPAITDSDTAIGTINDNDSLAASVVATDPTAAEVTPSNQTGTFIIDLGAINGTGTPITVNYGLTGSALNTTDYATIPTSVVIPNNQRTATITVVPVNDLITEGTEDVILTLAAGTGYTVGAPNSATVNITDNDTATISINDVAVDEGDGTATFNVTLTGILPGGFSVDFDTANGTAIAGVGNDYTANSGTLNFAGTNNEIEIITVTILEDFVEELTENFTVTLSGITGLATIDDAVGTGSINDNDSCTADIIAPAINPLVPTDFCDSIDQDLNAYTSTAPPAGTVLTWSRNPNPLITSAHLPTSVITLPGVYYGFFFDALDPCLSPTLQVDIILNPTPTVGSTTPDTICGTGTATLEATVAIGGILNWYDDPLAGNLLGTGSSFTTPLITETTTFYVEAIINNCPSLRVPVIATVNDPPTTGVATSTAACNVTNAGGPTTVDLDNTLVGADAGIWAVTTDPSGSVTIGAGNVVDFEGLPDGSYEFTYTTNTAVLPCTDVSVVVTISVNDCFIDTDNDGLTDGEEAVLGTDPNNPDSDGDTIQDGQEVTDTTDPLDDCDSIGGVPLPASDCDNDGISNGDEATLGTNPNDSDSDGDGIEDSPEVGNDIANPLDGDNDGIIDALDSNILDTDNDGVVDQLDPANLDPCIPDITAGPCVPEDIDLGVEKTVDRDRPLVGDQIVFTITLTNLSQVPVSNIAINDLLEVATGFQYVSHTASLGAYDSATGNWQLDEIAADAVHTLTITAEVPTSGTFTNTVTVLDSFPNDGNATNNTASITVIVNQRSSDECGFLFNQFSPNGDGSNDLLRINCIDQFPDNTIEIYDRYGNSVFEESGYANNWDGTGSNGELPRGTYFYILDLGDGSEVRKGWIQIIR